MRHLAARFLSTCAAWAVVVSWAVLAADGSAPQDAYARPGAAGMTNAVAATVVARGIPSPTNIAFDGRGRMWITSGAGAPSATDGVWLVPRKGAPRHVASGLNTALGLVWFRRVLYVGHITSPSNGRVTALSGFTGRRFRTRRVALDELTVGRHTVDSLVVGEAGRLYVGVGSAHDNQGLPGRIISFDPRVSRPRVEASGLRNPYGLAWWGQRLLVTDNGRDDLGPTQPPDELNSFDPSGSIARFGFPGCYGQGGFACRASLPALVRFPAHASSDGLAVRGDIAYIAENGSSFPANPTGNDVRCVNLKTLTHRRLWRAAVAHDPLGAAIGPDHRLYVTLFRSGAVVRFDIPLGC
jgi:glucose/arabinose dehydrogenase